MIRKLNHIPPRVRGARLAITAASTVLAFVACSKDTPTDPNPNPSGATDPDAYLLDSVPSWDVYSPLRPSVPAAPDSADGISTRRGSWT